MKDLAGGARPQDLVPGAPEEVEAFAARLAVYADQAGEAAARLRAIDAGAWVGEAGDAFRAAIGELPTKLQRGCGAFWDAVYALRAYATALREAQATAARAIQILTEADHQTSAWAARSAGYEELQRTGSAEDVSPAERAPALDDPGERLRQEALRMVERAREEVEAAARRSADRLKEAGDAAPNKPGFFRRALSAVGDFGRGAVEGTVGMATFAFKLTPTYALVDSEGYVENLAGMGKGLVYGVTHPVEFAKAVTNWDMWLDNPARALGQLVPDLALALATAGAGGAAKGAGAARRMARSGDEVAALGRATRSAEDLAELRRLARVKGSELIASASKAEEKVSPVLSDIARQHGGELAGFDHRLKKLDSLTRKISDEAAMRVDDLPLDELVQREGDGIKDVLRYTVQSDREQYMSTYDGVVSDLKDRDFALEKVKNTWAEPGTPQAGPYRGINTQWRTPDGQAFELQFHTPESFATKQATHEMYDEAREAATALERKQELNSIMSRISDEIPVPPGAIP